MKLVSIGIIKLYCYDEYFSYFNLFIIIKRINKKNFDVN